jgi:threonine aldolase
MKTHIIDLRSDTMTQPTAEMRQAMAVAVVGDDVYGEDPTVNELQDKTAELFTREAALFLPTGTMANQIAIRIYTSPGQEVICETRSHIVTSELGMMSDFSGCMARTIDSPNGILTWSDVRGHINRSASPRHGTGLIVLENTCNFAGGTVYDIATLKDIYENARRAELPVYVDGARIFNAAVALGVSVADVSCYCDSLMFSLSKGLGAPVGSVLLGNKEFITEARYVRKMLGGGMRQSGILAAAALIALQVGPALLAQDHENAKLLANALAANDRLRVDASAVITNIVLIDIGDLGCTSQQVVEALCRRGILVNAIDSRTIRLVTYRDISTEDCQRASETINRTVRSISDESHASSRLASGASYGTSVKTRIG